eukprot:scaffold124408_cov18-Tisochrysis_lutea.AAC.1
MRSACRIKKCDLKVKKKEKKRNRTSTTHPGINLSQLSRCYSAGAFAPKANPHLLPPHAHSPSIHAVLGTLLPTAAATTAAATTAADDDDGDNT